MGKEVSLANNESEARRTRIDSGRPVCCRGKPLHTKRPPGTSHDQTVVHCSIMGFHLGREDDKELITFYAPKEPIYQVVDANCNCR